MPLALSSIPLSVLAALIGFVFGLVCGVAATAFTLILATSKPQQPCCLDPIVDPPLHEGWHGGTV